MSRSFRLFALFALVVAAAGCGSAKKHAASKSSNASAVAPSISLAKQVLDGSELPRNVRATGERRTSSAKLLVRGLDPLFQPKTLSRRLTAAGFRRAVVENLQGRGKLAQSTGGFSAAVRLGSASAAARQVDFLHERSLSHCPDIKVCDVFWKPFAVPGIPGAEGSVRYRKVKTANGPPFDVYYIFFSAGPYAYGETVGGPPRAVKEAQLVHATTALYHRLHP